MLKSFSAEGFAEAARRVLGGELALRPASNPAACRFSVYRGCAAGLTFGGAGEEEFSDAIVRRPDVVALRRKVVSAVDGRIREEQADITAQLVGGRNVQVFVENAIGSFARPTTGADLDAKFHALATPILGAPRAQRLIDACRRVGTAPDVQH
ncbi:MAG: hypothetical protein ACOY5V_05510 [Pseudomonadota bacterium]